MKLVVILRGISGSGKSTLSQEIQKQHSDKSIVVCSADDYFIKEGQYKFNPSQLKWAHVYSRQRFFSALENEIDLVIVDNTNTQFWEFQNYLFGALAYGYEVKIEEPNTEWKFDAAELFKRNVHGVPMESIERMIKRWESREVIIEKAKEVIGKVFL